MMESQTNLILKHLKKGKTINPVQALTNFNCFRLAARISDLRRKGYNITTTMHKSRKKVWAVYSLIK